MLHSININRWSNKVPLNSKLAVNQRVTVTRGNTSRWWFFYLTDSPSSPGLQLIHLIFGQDLLNTNFSPFPPSPLWSGMGGCPVGHQVLSENAIYFYCQHLHPRGPISHVILHCIHPPFIQPPSLSLSLYPHLGHHSSCHQLLHGLPSLFISLTPLPKYIDTACKYRL